MKFIEALRNIQTIKEGVDIPEELLGQKKEITSGNDAKRLYISFSQGKDLQPSTRRIAPCKCAYVELEVKIPSGDWWTVRAAEVSIFSGGEREIVITSDGLMEKTVTNQISKQTLYFLSEAGVCRNGGATKASYGYGREGFINPTEKARRVREELRDVGFASFDKLPARIDVLATAQGIFALALEQLEKQQQGQVPEEFLIPELIIP